MGCMDAATDTWMVTSHRPHIISGHTPRLFFTKSENLWSMVVLMTHRVQGTFHLDFKFPSNSHIQVFLKPPSFPDTSTLLTIRGSKIDTKYFDYRQTLRMTQ